MINIQKQLEEQKSDIERVKYLEKIVAEKTIDSKTKSKLCETIVDLECNLLGDLKNLSSDKDNPNNRLYILNKYLKENLYYDNGSRVSDFVTIPSSLAEMGRKYCKSKECHLKIANKFFEMAKGFFELGTFWGNDEAYKDIDQAINIHKLYGLEQEGLEKAGDACHGLMAAEYYKRAGKLDKAKEAIKMEQTILGVSAAIIGIANKDLGDKVNKLSDSLEIS